VSPSTRVRLGAVGYLNARPLVYGLDLVPRFDIRYDVPSECARLLHDEAIDVGLIPSIEYLRGGPYRIVPDLAIVSRGPVASVALYTKKPMTDVRSIAMDTSSRTSVALVSVLCARLFMIDPVLEARGPDLSEMLDRCDAALIIGDNALVLDYTTVRPPAPRSAEGKPDTTEDATVRLPAPRSAEGKPDITEQSAIRSPQSAIEKIDLGEAWTTMTGLPFVYAFWAGRPNAVTRTDVEALQRARNAGVMQPEVIARDYFPGSPAHQAVGARYLQDNIKYYLRAEERAGLEAFFRYAAEADLVPNAGKIRFY
jgi:chorismate dehydratase